MPIYEKRTGQIHRFRDLVAVSSPTGMTEYYKPQEAQALALALIACADDVQARPFIESQFGTRRFEFLPLREGCDKPDFEQERGA
ncbi:MAG: hypothetical protein PHS57_08860 [Alphaproteobacteria bacterium]|nr:hypothetical protein [Alphaproteobacteria bacterium]